ncbi:hypothetical protein ACFQYP_56675 [Nonomuraea antimicrobica]
MSYEEKRAWVYAAVAVVVPVVYAVTMFGRLAGTDVTRISYALPLLIAAGVGIVANMLTTMLIGAPKGRDTATNGTPTSSGTARTSDTSSWRRVSSGRFC